MTIVLLNKIHDAIKRAALINRYEASSVNKREEVCNDNQRYEAHDNRRVHAHSCIMGNQGKIVKKQRGK